ncbi:hypothetical protein A1O1_01092 [Capronia coronata CBS 617.96]|uniref:Uncharacterized protein n=1 Tax=Capronia coronata CBS 617.96 TaxID=1182541 RepID=W9YSU9_9EURO|nr:uncharacterized protein A1O1_01092 [Capronia coronata CBS 617.96]EXJ95967.1 hypothetical protein A1O1_01092 [Capronia coronata CBS 617.96]
MACWHDRPATAPRFPCLILCLLPILLRVTSALQSVPGSPCEPVCSAAGSLEDDVVCLDANYRSLEQGRNFQECVACQLNSTAVDTGNNETDVEWALLALRYTLAGCMFAIPEQHISISSPCQVSCAPLNASIGYQIKNDSSTRPDNNFCNVGQFDDTDINKCALCYSFIPQQLFLANFLQALHIVCRQPPIPGRPFYPDAASIFNETLIAGPSTSSNGSGSGSGLHGWQLGVAIALPIVGGILLIGGSCWGCFVFTRKRRQRMAQTGRMSKIHDAHAGGMYSPMSAKAEAWGQTEPPREMHAISPTLLHTKQPSPGLAQGRWSHQTDGSEQGTPLRTSFQHGDVGPGTGQVRDPDLHEQFFAVGDDTDQLPGPSAQNVYYDVHPHEQLQVPDERNGRFI